MPRAGKPSAPLQIQNATRGQTLVSRGRVAAGFLSRLRGLIGSRPLAPGEGLLIVPCSSIHTHFMRFPIDVLYVNRAHEIVGLDPAVPPWRFGRFYPRVRYVVELPPGMAAQTGTQVGDRLHVAGYEFA